MEPGVPLGAQHRVRVVVLALAGIGGWLDGLTFTAFGGVFVSAVTGDLVQVGITAERGDWRDLALLLVALTAFVAGTALSVLLVRAVGETVWPGPVRRPLLVHAAILVVFAIAWTLAADPRAGSAEAYAIVAVAALSTGVQGAAVLGLGVRGVSVNAVTGVLMLLGASLAERGGRVPGPRAGVPPWMLAMILVVYTASGFLVAVAFGAHRVVAWMPALVALAVLAAIPSACAPGRAVARDHGELEARAEEVDARGHQ